MLSYTETYKKSRLPLLLLDNEEPIRGPMFSLERLDEHAESLAQAQVITRDSRRSKPVLPRLIDNQQTLLLTYNVISKAVAEERAITPAAEWLLDNYHVLDEQIREIRSSLPRNYYRELPKLAAGPLAGYPRLYGIAWNFVAHTDSRFDPNTFARFIEAYQRVTPLTLGEVWAVAIHLRVVLVENLRRLGDWTVVWQTARREADALADGLLGLNEQTQLESAAAMRRLEQAPLSTAFVVQLVQRLREQDPRGLPVLDWLLERLAAQGTTADDLVSKEHQRQAASNITVSNIITSMRTISAFDWETFVERVSLVELTLRKDSGYAELDFATRDRYRHVIEELGKGLSLSEPTIAQRLLDKVAAMAGSNVAHFFTDRQADLGYYLIDKGRAEFERELGFQAPPTRWLYRAFLAFAIPGYLGTLFVVTALLLATAIGLDARAGAGRLELFLLALLGLIPAFDLAAALVNRFVTGVVPPRVLPKLGLRDGVPADLRTVVAVPALLVNADTVQSLVEQLEVRYLANADGDIRFALVSDWIDAPTEKLPGDDALLTLANERIQTLNARYGPLPDGSERFFLFHRKRVWNQSENCWMGWERKRGKLHELNRLLRGASDTSFMAVPDQGLPVPPGVRFVITLDTDTQLPRGTATRLIGTLAHPLNRAKLDPKTHRVIAGYGILQPRITPAMPAEGEDSWFRRVFTSPAGLDPYVAAVSDVYQDLFAEGSYTGKGIYDIDAYETALGGRIPENTLLSHDLFEGLFARAGLLTDVELVEPYPASYVTHTARQHRWVRGDWQLLPWLFSNLAPISPIGRWKMLDNLRRSLTAPATFLSLLAAWTLPLASPWLWTGFVFTTLVMPPLLPALAGLQPRHAGISRRSYLRRIGQDLGTALARVGLTLMLLAHQTWLDGDAILRTLWRLLSRRRLLEWRTAAEATEQVDDSLAGFYRRMLGASLLAGISGCLVLWQQTPGWPLSLPFLLAWLISPAVARAISLPLPGLTLQVVPPPEVRPLRQIARRTWHYFERFVGPEDHFLPPDNVQEDPKEVIARRTSPTNIGLYLLSTLTAHDFGWIGKTEAVERVTHTLDILERLEKYQGHLYNWYDTRDLHVLMPRYVSSVDSGNLAGHLLVLRQALLEWSEVTPRFATPSLEPMFLGLEDTVGLLREAAAGLEGPKTGIVTRSQLEQVLEALELTLATARDNPPLSHDLQADILRTLRAEAKTLAAIARTLVAERGAALSELNLWAQALQATLESSYQDWRVTDAEIHVQAANLAARVSVLLQAMRFDFLFDPTRKLFHIGYDADSQRPDAGYFDLLASEARLTSFLAIASGDVPTAHWFRMGRALTPAGRGSALVSWSGSMFEYLMPALVMDDPKGSLLHQTYQQVVARQISYGRERGVPWGVSESAFFARDLELNYQYSAFGVPGLGLKRGLADDLVIAPYATALAAMVNPSAAAQNFRDLTGLGALGRYGFYDALDYTKKRLPQAQSLVIVRSYMAHHQGMSLVALANTLLAGKMRQRFHADPRVQATQMLLQERLPRDVVVARPRVQELEAGVHVRELEPVLRRVTTINDTPPATQLLSNGRYAVMLTAAGSGYSRWRDLAVTRWREDPTRDAWGSYLFVREVRSGEVWSATAQPPLAHPSTPEDDELEVQFFEERARLFRRTGEIASTLQVMVSPEDDAEIRRVAIKNHSLWPKELDLTSYAEIVLAPPQADTAHPAFAKLFVQTEYVAETGVLLATRRPRSPDESRVWAAHLVTVDGQALGALQFETDRARFLGRGHELQGAVALRDGKILSGTVGPVLDPIFSLRRRVRLEPGAVARISFTTVVGETRDEVLGVIDKYRDPATFERVLALAWTQAQVELRHLGISPTEAQLFQELSAHLLYSDAQLRPPSEVLARTLPSQAALWKHGISGDLPIVVIRIGQGDERTLVRQMIRAFQYWRRKRLAMDLVILNEQAPSYVQDMQSGLESLVELSRPSSGLEDPQLRGGVFVVRADRFDLVELSHLQSAARVVLRSNQGSLADQLSRLQKTKADKPLARKPLPRVSVLRPPATLPQPLPQPELAFFNGLGGFSQEGKEYVILLGEGQWTPAPWVNVIANARFGFIASEAGSGYTWALNSRENKLTTWSNDPVSDPPSEVFYVRDDDTGEVFGPTASPIRHEANPYLVRHGQGYSQFSHESHGMALELLQFVPLEDPIKLSRLKLENRTTRTRRLSVSAYVEWVLGAFRDTSAPSTTTELDPDTGAILAHNAWNPEFAGRVTFVDLGGKQQTWTCDRSEFLGRNGTLERPAALHSGVRLSGKVGSGLDPCTVLQTKLAIPPGGAVELVFTLGQGANREEARQLVTKYRQTDSEAVLQEVKQFWNELLTTVQVKTPDPALDIMLNGWLLYQTLSCRIWARAGFYQAGGAYGFRDQLQDVMALVVAKPELAREQLLRAAAHQFVEGDVQHWWHPPGNRGVRTHFSDDRLWLPFTLTHYLETTKDVAVLDEAIPFLEGQAIPEGHEDAYFEATVSEPKATLYEHAARALDCSLALGSHGLPLMGTGDWNDGLNRVGHEGKGESVWLAWFLHTNLREWAKLAAARGETTRAKTWRTHLRKLKHALEHEAWDGDWYLRAFFDDGSPLGSAQNSECRIDAIAQSWAVLSGAAEPARASRAMAAVEQHLVRRGDGLVLLFTPPFEHTEQDPGYIKGYLPGIRENGGQYTHAAIWTTLAFAALGEGDKVAELLAILNPIHQTETRAGVYRYKVEPYVVAADVYGEPPHVGRGGWSWYTGSAGWLYRAGLEGLLGFHLRGPHLTIDPCIPKLWPRFEMTFKYRATSYHIRVENPHGASRGVKGLELDGKAVAGPDIELVDDGALHSLRVTLGETVTDS
jgi:cyclic beta-1,2-glucan synthetase